MSAGKQDAESTVVGRISIIDHANVRYVVRGVSRRLSELGLHVTVHEAAQAGAELRDCHVLMTCSAFNCSAEVMGRLPGLVGITALAAGTETIDVAAATRRGLVVAHAPTPENVVSMAESSIMLILASLYRLPETAARFRRGWDRPTEPYARTLAGKTVGLIGFGKIARAVAHRLTDWNVQLITYSPRASADDIPSDVRCVDLPTLLRESDVISIHAALHEGNLGLVDEHFLGQMKSGAVLVNTARGGLVNEQALIKQAAADKPSYVALDCFIQEPLPDDSPLRELPNALLTPHMVGHTQEVQQSLIEQGVKNVLDILSRRRPAYIRNPEVLDRWLSTAASTP